MQVEELTKKIYEEYPIVWKKLKEKYHMWSVYKDYIDLVFSLEYAEFNFYNLRGEGYLIPVDFSMLYGLLEDFFEEDRITINITFDIEEQKYWVEIIDDLFSEYCEPENLFEEKDDVRIFSILKACEILEKGNYVISK